MMGDEGNANAWRRFAISLVLGAIFALGLSLYVFRTMPNPSPSKLSLESDAGSRITNEFAGGERIAVAFVDHLGAARFEDAYLLMAGSYRAHASAEDFRKAWASPLLAGPRRFRPTSSRAQSTPLPGGGLVAPAIFTTRGVLVASAGALEVSFTFQAKGQGGRDAEEPRVLAVMVGGVPIVQGFVPQN